ncbi:unnamed protein product, partial [Heterosigma akashiwo]
MHGLHTRVRVVRVPPNWLGVGKSYFFCLSGPCCCSCQDTMPAKSSRGGSGWAFVMISILRFVLCWELLGLCFSPQCEHHYVAGFQPQMSPLQTWKLVDSRRSPVHALKAAPTDVQIYEEKIEIRGEEMWYQIVAPSVQKLLATAHEPLVPLVCLHGGPGVPSASLEPLGRLAEEYGRTVIFYDQLGCGNSGAPMDPAFYSPSLLHSDLLVLMAHLRDVHDLRACHLLGHSWGGCLACEAVLGVSHSSTGSPLIPGQDNGVFLLVPDVELLSVVLSGTPSSIPLVEEEVGRLVEALAASSASQQQGGADPEDSLFKATHYCRLPETP